MLIVEGPCDDLDAATLHAEANRLQGGCGLRHRREFVDDDALGVRLEQGLSALGWQARPFGLMVHRGPLRRPHDPAVAREVDLGALQEIHATFVRTQSYGADPEVVRQLVEADAVMSRAGGGRHFAGYDGDRPGCFMSMYGDRETAQLQAMATLPAARGKGLAGNVMALGVRTAADAGCETTTLATVEEVAWLRASYERMGFALVGRWWAFTRLPG